MPGLSRRDFARLVGLTSTAALFPPALARGFDAGDAFDLDPRPVQAPPANPDEPYWRDIRARFLVPRDVSFFNAANLCPTSLPAVEAIEQNVRSYEAGPTPEARTVLMRQREEARTALATALRVKPEEIVITRNTTESNNFISSGLDLKPGDEVIVWADNHPSNLTAWRTKAQRFGFTVVTVPLVLRHPGVQGYVDLFTKAFTARTKVVAVTHVNSNSGDLLPVAEICAAARARGILSLVDGAQAFGVLDLDLGQIKPDFYTGSMHKWPCGPKEKGMLFASAAVHDRIFPSVVGVYGGQVGLSRTFEACGQRDDASIAAVPAALKLQSTIGAAVIEKRSRELAGALMKSLAALPGVKLWTDPAPAHSAAIVIFQPGSLDVRRLGTALTAQKIIVTTRTGQTNPGLRMSPHFYNTMDDVDRAVAAIKTHLANGV